MTEFASVFVVGLGSNVGLTDAVVFGAMVQ
jgi:hypothetical protein